MARKGLQSWIVLRAVHLFSLCIFIQSSIICETRRVSRSEEEGIIRQQSNFSSGMYLYTSSDMTIRLGQQLLLNCTVLGAVNPSQVQFSWYHGTQRLTNLTRQLNDKTIQLLINNVSWSDSGTYVCRENTSNRVQPMSVTVRVGDLPGPPQDVWINNVELETYVHWKAPWYQGGLQLSYAVKARCKNASAPLPICSLKDFLTFCEGIRPQQGSESGPFVCQIRSILKQFYPHTFTLVPYIGFVEASNVLGSRMSRPVEFTFNILSSLIYTTPRPAVFLTAEEVTPPGTVKISWEDARRGRLIEVEYTILYHKDGDSQNKSLTVKAPKTNALVPDLVGFSLYYFYLLIRYAEKNTDTYGIYSEATQRTVRTDVSAPRDPPEITNCSHWMNASSDPRLMISWRIPDDEYFIGPKKSAAIFYSCSQGSGNVSLNDTSACSAVITAVEPSDSCHVWMKLCNEPGLCSSISNICFTPSILKGNSSSGPKNSKNSVTKVLLSVAGASVGGVLVIIIAMCYRRRRQNGPPRPPLRSVLVMPSVIHGYNEAEVPLVNNCYDVISV